MPNSKGKLQIHTAQSSADLLERLAEADQGRFVSADSIEEWVASWLTPDELPPPDPDLHFGRDE